MDYRFLDVEGGLLFDLQEALRQRICPAVSAKREKGL